MSLVGKKIIVAVSGSIAAYKSALLVRQLIKAGAQVQVLMTKAATDFITPLTLATLSKRPVYSDIASGDSWNNHVAMGLWADALVVAPATATTLAKMAHAICDNVIVATYLSARCPVFFAPAMDLDMWAHPATQRNVAALQTYGNQLIAVENGELASGLHGAGRMAEPETIVQHLYWYFASPHPRPLAGKTAIVTAGPTYEPIDPVRFIGNHSSGKMGIAIADTLAAYGAAVTLVIGPSKLRPTHHAVETVAVGAAQAMYEAVEARFASADIAVLSAAVADYRPKHYADKKIKKKSDDMLLELDKTIDIAATLGRTKRPDQVMVGFALETDNEQANALAKLQRKNFDFIVLNSLQDAGAGFQHDTNKITILDKYNTITPYELKSKADVAQDIVAKIVTSFKPY